MKLLKFILGLVAGLSGVIALFAGGKSKQKVKEIKKDIRKQMRANKVNAWKEFWHFWPLSIVVPIMLISIILGPIFTR